MEAEWQEACQLWGCVWGKKQFAAVARCMSPEEIWSNFTYIYNICVANKIDRVCHNQAVLSSGRIMFEHLEISCIGSYWGNMLWRLSCCFCVAMDTRTAKQYPLLQRFKKPRTMKWSIMVTQITRCFCMYTHAHACALTWTGLQKSNLCWKWSGTMLEYAVGALQKGWASLFQGGVWQSDLLLYFLFPVLSAAVLPAPSLTYPVPHTRASNATCGPCATGEAPLPRTTCPPCISTMCMHHCAPRRHFFTANQMVSYTTFWNKLLH